MQNLKTKEKIFLFTDGSVNPRSGVGYGACLFLDKLESPLRGLENKIKIKKFEDTSSTKLELETLLWALDEACLENYDVVVYTDCQNIIGLLARRDCFERKNYMTSKGNQIKNHELYKSFYKRLDTLDCELIKVKGHKKSSQKNIVDDIFTLVDKASRDALRKVIHT
ncbi:RNase H family protein [uncultured Sulfurimonas sp.]|jgi:ribonuclease HI|nr:ribonuclease H [Sulfurimonas sp.]